MRFWDRLLTSLVQNLSQRVFQGIRQWLGVGAVEAAQDTLEQGYRTAHKTGAQWSVLDLLGVRTRVEATPEALETLAQSRGLDVQVTQQQAVKRLESQIAIAKTRLAENADIPTTSANAAGFAVRWGVQQGIADVAENSKVLHDGEPTEILKEWIRLAARAERRAWHDALIGVRIPYSAKFRLESPRGIFLIERPYAANLPLSEKIHCGHGIRLVLPGGTDELSIWQGQEKAPIGESGQNPPANPRPSPYKPIGIPFNENVSVPVGPMAARVEHTVGQIAAVHGAGEMPPIGVRFVGKIPDGLAQYAYDNTNQAAGVIKVSSKADVLDIVHELGHSVDHQLFGSRGVLGSLRRDSQLRGLLALAEQTPTIQRYRQALEDGRIFLQGTPRPLTPIRRDRVEYMLKPQEVFARIYSQYIAITSGDPEMLQIVGAKRLGASNVWYPSYWNEDEFEELAKELERLFRINRLTR